MPKHNQSKKKKKKKTLFALEQKTGKKIMFRSFIISDLKLCNCELEIKDWLQKERGRMFESFGKVWELLINRMRHSVNIFNIAG